MAGTPPTAFAHIGETQRLQTQRDAARVQLIEAEASAVRAETSAIELEAEAAAARVTVAEAEAALETHTKRQKVGVPGSSTAKSGSAPAEQPPPNFKVCSKYTRKTCARDT